MEKKDIIALALLAVTMCLQFVVPADSENYWIGALLSLGILVGVPTILYKTAIPKGSHKTQNKSEWKTVDVGAFEKCMDKCKACGEVPCKGPLMWIIYGIYVVTNNLIICIIFICIGGFTCLIQTVYGMIIFDACLVSHYLCKMLGLTTQKVGIKPFEEKLDNIRTMLKASEHFIHWDTELQVDMTKDSPHTIKDVRIRFAPREKINNLLCSLASVSMNKVQTDKYPYMYFVAVFSKTSPDVKSNLKQLAERIPGQDRIFMAEVNSQEDNYIFLVKKSASPEYTTDDDDVTALADIIDSCGAKLHKAFG